ncbi:hypothetical protein CANMA_002736 [Candida margitis]|uniref:uncharacterized protein n=1 Tax=Candida margitis TaxID=1775924 RepID=UPI002227552C|nr:uncharacterized protein CANMA_002736 [Candida margitis]KAI5967968.1 hypothetical protein CANMA_002736 [Candida margitis]
MSNNVQEPHSQQHQHQHQHQHKPKYGPPQHIKPRHYHAMLDLLESQANKKLTSEYSTEFVQTLAQLESASSVNPAMIDLQPEIQWFMRPFLLDFLIELHSSFRLQPQTLFLCLNIIDRYCAKRIVFKRHYQLVGCTALWIAGKYEDKKSRVPTLKELTIMCRNAYDEEMFVQMEMHILSTLEWSIGHPTLEDCLQLSIKHSNIVGASITPPKYSLQAIHAANVAGGASEQVVKSAAASTLSAVTAVGRFLCELSLYDKFFLSVPTSLVAYTANLLACSMLQLPNASISLKEMLEAVIIEPKRRQHLQMKLQNRLKRKQERQLRRQQQQSSSQSSQRKTQLQNIGAVPKFPLKQKMNTLYSNNNDSNYSHQNTINRHSSIADDIDLDCEESDQEDVDTDTDADTDRDADIDHDALDDDEPVFNETNDTTFDNIAEDEEIENKLPEIHGAFLNGLDESTLLTIKKTALMLVIQLNKVTEVLTKKYESVGVIQVLKKFHEKNSFLIQSIYENKDKLVATLDSSTALIDSRFVQTIEILLQFPQLSDPTLDSDSEPDSEDDEDDEYCVNPYSSYKAYESDDYFSVRGSGAAGHLRTPKSPHPFFGPSTLGFDSNSIAPPVTPPSATSQYSVFSNKRSGGSQTNSVTSNCNTPTHFPISSFASSSSAVTQQQQQQQQQHAVMMGSSQPSLCRTKSKIRKKRAMMQSSATSINTSSSSSVMIPPILPTVATGHEATVNDKCNGFSPIKPVANSSASLNTSSPLMNQYF